MGDKAMTNREAPANVKRKWNWRIWSGFLLAVAAAPSYFLFFARFPITRNVPWANWLMFAAAGGLLVAGVRSAFANPEVYRGKIVGLILAVLSFGAADFSRMQRCMLRASCPRRRARRQLGTGRRNLRLPTRREEWSRSPCCFPSRCREYRGESHEAFY